MHSYYKNARPVDYRADVKSLDFAIQRLGEFENITYAETKNAVDLAIEIQNSFNTNIWKQGKQIGKKIFGQTQLGLAKFQT